MTTPDDVPELDLSLAALFAGWALNDEVTRRLAARGFTGLRFSHGFLVQRLIDRGAVDRRDRAGARRDPAGRLEDRLGARRPRLRPPPARPARRSRPPRVAHRPRPGGGRRRRARSGAAVVAELRERLGPRRVDAAAKVLREVLSAHGDGRGGARPSRPPTGLNVGRDHHPAALSVLRPARLHRARRRGARLGVPQRGLPGVRPADRRERARAGRAARPGRLTALSRS